MQKSVLSICVGVFAVIWAGCSGSGPKNNVDRENTTIVVAVSNYPLKYFAERIAGGHAEIIFPIDSAGDPAFWTPTDEGVKQMQNSDVLFVNGAGYESWLQMATISKSKIVDSSAAFDDQLIPIDDEVVHQHGPEGEHSHKGTAFTTWLDPQLATLQAKAIRDWLAKKMPNSRTEFEDNFKLLSDELNKLDDRLDSLNSLGGAPLLGSHPVYQYLARRAKLNLRSVHFEPDSDPSDEQWTALEQLLEKHPAKIMLWEDDPLDQVAARLRELGVEPVVFRPAGNALESGDWLSEMNANIDRLEEASKNLTASDSK